MRVTRRQLKKLIRESIGLDLYLKNLGQAKDRSFKAGMAKERESDDALTKQKEIDSALIENEPLISACVERLKVLLKKKENLLFSLRQSQAIYEGVRGYPTPPDTKYNVIPPLKKKKVPYSLRKYFGRKDNENEIKIKNFIRETNERIREEAKLLNSLSFGTHPMLDELSEYLD